jgi:DNA primase
MEKKRINFETLKNRVSIRDIIEYFNLELKEIKPNQFRGNCPFLHHGGDRDSKSFSINTEKGLFICPTHCGGGSGVIDFYCGLKGYDKTRDSLQAAKDLQEIFCNGIASHPKHVDIKEPVKEKEGNKVCKIRLDVEQNVDYLLKTKKLDFETLKFFEVGKAKYGVLKDKIAVPVHNKYGELVGYAGQNVDTGKWSFWFLKSIELFGFHRVKKLKTIEQVIIVESFYSAMYLYQCGFQNVVAIMGIWASDKQIELLKELSDNFFIFLDNDEAGKKGVSTLKKKLKKEGLKFQVVEGLVKRKPLDYPVEELNKILVQKNGK